MGFSRVALDRHWASDVFVGAVVGHLVSRLVVRGHTAGASGSCRPSACSGRAVVLGLSITTSVPAPDDDPRNG
ncbi:MAG: hypothetical protein M0C28_27020 [Candidatus Moduliflexus flocculans]|nr:hypothetical protein [Candidatus Moduliflexus flocculans]